MRRPHGAHVLFGLLQCNKTHDIPPGPVGGLPGLEKDRPMFLVIAYRFVRDVIVGIADLRRSLSDRCVFMAD